MIEFLQDYSTKAIPPEVFKNEERVERSPESELYFVRLGLAAYVTADGLVDADYRAVERVPVVAIVTKPVEQPLSTGRAGEVPVSVSPPGQATSGPGTAAVLGLDLATAAEAAPDVVPVDAPEASPTDVADAAGTGTGRGRRAAPAQA